MAEARVALTTMREHAPASVATAVSTVAEPFNALLDAFEKNRFEPGSADPSAMGAPEVQKASETLKADTPKTCGVKLP